jgi:hypothetical protein
MHTLKRIALLVLLVLPGSAFADAPTVQVYKSPTCGCCVKWIAHLEANGFEVKATDVANVTPIKRENGIPKRLESCHTAFVGGYAIEGHVPAAEIHRLLREKPAVAGLAVPGMPIGSPGMEGPNPEPYDVLSFDSAGRLAVFSHRSP